MASIRELITLIENATGQTVKLTDLYDEDELNDEREILYDYVDADDLSRDFIVRSMTPQEAKTYKTAQNDMTVFNAFKKFASKEQKSLVKEKKAHYDVNRIIVVINDTVLDGNHQLIAGILANMSIKYINLAEY